MLKGFCILLPSVFLAAFLFASLISQKRSAKAGISVSLTLLFSIVRKVSPKFFHPYFYPDFLFLAAVFYFSKDLPRKLRIGIVISTIITFALAQMFWMGFSSPISLFDIYAIKEVYAYSTLIFCTLIAAVIFILVVGFLTLWKIGKKPLVWIFIVAAYGTTYLLPPPNVWSSYQTYMKRGAIVCLISEVFQQSKRMLYSSDQRHLYYLGQDLKITQKRNVNVLILESLLVPHLLTDELKNLNVKLELPWQKMISPTFGGQSARSEFEILCGVPSYKKPFVEFNSIIRDIHCLPNFLKKFGYQTIVSNASSPETFNAPRAYTYLGFDKQIWHKRNKKHATEMETLSKGVIYDGSLLNENLANLKDFKTPYLNYIVGTYGHMPFSDNEVKRPRLFHSKDKQLEKVINIQIYREKEVIKWLDHLNKTDKEAINIVCGDHLPYLNNVNFGDMGYTNFCVSNIKLLESNFYKIPVQILKELGCEKCALPTDMESQYAYLLF